MEAVGRSYEEINPFCKRRKDESEIIEIHLQGFKKEQVRVQLNNVGILVVTGERPVDQTKWEKFRKEFKVSEDCVRDEIRAKLTHGILLITMPKRTTVFPGMAQMGGGKTAQMGGGKRALKLEAMAAVTAVVAAAVVGVGAYVAYKYYMSF